MLNAGIEINSDIIKCVDEINEGKKDFSIFKIKDRKEIVCVQSYPNTSDDIKEFNDDKDRESNWKNRVYPKLFETLKTERDPLFLVLDFKYVVNSRKCSKLYFIGWSPDTSSVKDRMIFSATFKQFADKANIPIRFIAHLPVDITYEELLGKTEKY